MSAVVVLELNEYHILGVVKRNPLFLHEIEWKNNGFLFITSNIYTDRNNTESFKNSKMLIFTRDKHTFHT